MDAPWLAHINLQFLYILGSALVAVLIWIEGQMLKKTQGKLPKSKFFHLSSVIDTFWVVISIAAIYLLDLQSIAMAVPAAYCIYTVAGWVYGSRLLRRNGMPDSTKNLVIPKSYVAFSQSFALIFFSLCLLVLVSPWPPIPQLKQT